MKDRIELAKYFAELGFKVGGGKAKDLQKEILNEF